MHAQDVRSCMDASRAADARRKILVLEEDEYLASLLYFLLAREGFTISAFADLHTVQGYLGNHEPAGMIFVSHRWLRSEQPPFMASLAQQPSWTMTPIVMLMNYYDLDLIEHAAMLGISDYLLQPFEPEQLLNVIQKYLQS